MGEGWRIARPRSVIDQVNCRSVPMVTTSAPLGDVTTGGPIGGLGGVCARAGPAEASRQC